MPNNNNQILGWLIIAGLVVFVLIAILQFLTFIFMILTVLSIIATIILLIFGLTKNEWEDEPYFIYALIAFLCIFASFFLGRATYSASEALSNNEITSGLMQITATFFFIQEQKQEAIQQIEDAQMQALNNLTEEIINQTWKD